MNLTCHSGNGSTKLWGSRMQAVTLNPEICIVVDIRIISKQREKADAVDAVEGSSPESVMASDQDTTGV